MEIRQCDACFGWTVLSSHQSEGPCCMHCKSAMNAEQDLEEQDLYDDELLGA